MTLFEEFYRSFEALDQERCIQLSYDALSSESISIEDLYEDVLRKSLSFLTDNESDPTHKIWKEHIQSAIVRTIIEMAYPFVLKQRKLNLNKKAAIVCPDGEQHELGARMVSDYLRLLGYETYFVGRDTPRLEFLDMIKTLDLDVVAISVTNYYNLSKALQTVVDVKEHFPEVTLVAGGRGLDVNSEVLVKHDVMITHDLNDLKRYLGENA
jgi:methanogenic corrinoid protein MtbC1